MSGGERQRTTLGRAFSAISQAMLLDSIKSLDTRLCEEMRVELKRLQRENNQTFVHVSHDEEEEVMAISDRVAVVIDGGIAQIGTPDEIYGRQVSQEVAKVIGSPPMNLIDGEIY